MWFRRGRERKRRRGRALERKNREGRDKHEEGKRGRGEIARECKEGKLAACGVGYREGRGERKRNYIVVRHQTSTGRKEGREGGRGRGMDEPNVLG